MSSSVLNSSPEAELFQHVSRSLSRTQQISAAIASAASLVLELGGVSGVVLDLTVPDQSCQTEFGDPNSSRAWAVGELTCGSHRFGSLRIFFDPHWHELTCPIKTACFLGQQIASAFAMSQLVQTNKQLRKQQKVLAERLETRKVYSRAMAILQGDHNLSEVQARRFLVAAARNLRKPLLYAARTIVTLESSSQFQIQVKSYRSEKRQHYVRRSPFI